jgi:hypothetical protein
MSQQSKGENSPSLFSLSESTLGDAEVVARQAMQLLDLPQVNAASSAIRNEYFLRRKAARLADGIARLDNAVNELTFAALLSTSAADAFNPRLAYFNAPSLETSDGEIPAGRHGFDNADRVFRYFSADPACEYEICGTRSPGSEALSFHIEACEAKAPGWGMPQSFLRLEDIDFGEDGAFSVTADSSPLDGRRNHLHLPPNVGNVLLRDTLLDWSRELPAAVTVRRISGPNMPPWSLAKMAEKAPESVHGYARDMFAWHDVGLEPIEHNAQPRVHSRPSPWGKPWGMTAAARFQITDEEALIITVDPQSARYLGIQLTDPWMVSVDYRHRFSSLNNHQAWHNPDGTITYIVAINDPSAVNWLDPGGLHSGAMLIRWEIFQDASNPDSAIRSFQKIKLRDLDAVLPFSMPHVSSNAREQMRATRYAQYLRRLEVMLPPS